MSLATHSLRASASATPSATDLASAQHIRQVYAYLDQVGVPGDGFSDGIERTREYRRLSNILALSNQSHPEQLSDAEIKILQDSDRYGFFKPPSSERTICLPSNSFYPLNRSASSPILLSGDNTTSNNAKPFLSNKYSQESLIKETNRIEKWCEMLQVSQRDQGSNQLTYRLNPEWDQQRSRFEKRCFKGIPDRWRKAAWEMLLDDYGQRNHQPHNMTGDQLRKQFKALLHEPNDQDIQIDLDVPRTINGHIFFHTRYGKGQRALFKVLHTFGMYCETCGYCQGMGPIAATLLSYYSAEDAYVCMVRIHDDYDFHNVFSPGFPGLLECFYVQEKLIEYLIPAVHKTFTEQMISTSAYATKWYITIFANSVCYEAQLRLWDIFFLKGIDVLILGAVSMVYSLRNKIGPGHDFEQILSILGGRFEIPDSYRWIRSIRKLLNRSEVSDLIDKSRREWKSFVQDGSAPKRVT